MALISQAKVKAFLKIGDEATTSIQRGRALEDLVCYIVTKVPGVSTPFRNALDAFGAEEIDIALSNDQLPSGFRFLPPQLLVECKNHSVPLGSQEVGHFSTVLQNNGCTHGFLFATHGITGDSGLLTAAHHHIADALRDGIRIIVVDRQEILALTSGVDLISLTKMKLCMLTAKRTSIG